MTDEMHAKIRHPGIAAEPSLPCGLRASVLRADPVRILALVDAEILALPDGIDTPASANHWLGRVRPEAGSALLVQAIGDAERRSRPATALAFRDGARA